MRLFDFVNKRRGEEESRQQKSALVVRRASRSQDSSSPLLLLKSAFSSFVLGSSLLLLAACGVDPEQPAVQVPWHTEFAAAAAEATATKRPILADFQGSDWCPTCVELHKAVFSTAQFAAWAKEHVVLLDVDLPTSKPQPPAIKAQNEALAERHRVSQFPTILLLDATGAKVAEVPVNNRTFEPAGFIAAAEAVLPK